ncbi:hydroxylysine kinase [Arctopsyche grandis]|uniref:hydroxylysine kinase n=1 Tax=Arctopsyche grandis TaxID=121162 RepID=UPI00406D8190
MVKTNSDGDKTSSKILQSGEVIKPEIDDESVKALAERLYGISCLELKHLNGYDDKNYKITEDTNMKNPLITKHWPHGYVLKIMNSMDSEKLSSVEAQTETMLFLASHQINCPKPIRNVYGHYFSREKLSSGKHHIVRLLEYQPGETLLTVTRSEFLYYQVGEYVANLNRLLKGFSHSGYMNLDHIWMLQNVPKVVDFKDAVKEPELLEILDQVIKAFQDQVMPVIPTLDKGLIHGDINEHNIIVSLKDPAKENDWRISAILDFGDSHKSCYLFELAIAMAYMMLLTGDVKTGGFVLAGYSTVRIVPEKELKLLRICIAARLCQSLVMGAYTHQQDSSNTYVLSSRKGALALLPLIWNQTDEEIGELWKTVADDYLTRSSR